MPRPNLAQDAPPTEITVEGVSYEIKFDFRVWIDVLKQMRGLIPMPNSLDQAMRNAEILQSVETAIFGKVIPHPAAEVLPKLIEFSQGYPEAPAEGGNGGAQTYSFEWDLNFIIIAIMNQFGIDLTWRRTEPFHWWEFLLYFRALSGSHYILRLMEIRGYDGKDEELRKQARRFALPRESDGEDQAILDQFDELFYNS